MPKVKTILLKTIDSSLNEISFNIDVFFSAKTEKFTAEIPEELLISSSFKKEIESQSFKGLENEILDIEKHYKFFITDITTVSKVVLMNYKDYKGRFDNKIDEKEQFSLGFIVAQKEGSNAGTLQEKDENNMFEKDIYRFNKEQFKILFKETSFENREIPELTRKELLSVNKYIEFQHTEEKERFLSEIDNKVNYIVNLMESFLNIEEEKINEIIGSSNFPMIS